MKRHEFLMMLSGIVLALGLIISPILVEATSPTLTIPILSATSSQTIGEWDSLWDMGKYHYAAAKMDAWRDVAKLQEVKRRRLAEGTLLGYSQDTLDDMSVKLVANIRTKAIYAQVGIDIANYVEPPTEGSGEGI